MKILINTHQLSVLASNFHIIEGRDGLTEIGKYPILESKLPEYLVRLFVHGQPCELRISGYSKASVLSLARALFPKATITGSAILIR